MGLIVFLLICAALISDYTRIFQHWKSLDSNFSRVKSTANFCSPILCTPYSQLLR